ncbi:hypothetical protein ES707_13529 [subsurface metagenome]
MAVIKQKKASFKGDGIVIFQDVSQAMKAEKIVRGAAGYEAKLVAPPRKFRMGCDLALEINLVEKAGIERLLKEQDAPYISIFPITKGVLEILDIVKVTDFGNWIMVKAGNMKLAYEKKSGLIVNTSGGGCPDIPYLHAELIDRLLTEAPRPRDLGFTLCALMLDRAFEESLTLQQGGK